MSIINTLFSYFKKEKDNSVAANNMFSAMSDVSAMTSFPDLEAIWDDDPINTIPRDLHFTPISVLAGMTLNGTEDAILGYKLVKVNDDGSVDVNVKGAKVEVGNLEVQLEADPDDVGEKADSVLIYGATSVDTPEKLLTISRRLQVDAAITTSGTGIKTDTDDGSIASDQTDVTLSLDLLYGFDGVNWERIKSGTGRLIIDGSQVTQPISATALPLPTGAATETKQDTGNTSLSSIDTKLTDGTQKTRILDTSGNGLTSTIVGLKQSLDVNIAAGSSGGIVDDDDGSIAPGQTDILLNLDLLHTFNGVTWERVSSSSNRLIVDNSQVTQPISATALPLPTGAATEITLSSIDGKLNSLGQKTMPASVPVVIASDQSTIQIDVTDETARELGRVLSSETLYITESYVTVDAFANARQTNGDFNLRNHKTKTLVIKNTGGVNAARINIFGSVDNGTNFDITIVSNTNLTAGSILVTNEERAMTHIRVEARSATAGNSTTVETRCYALGT